MKVQRTLHLSRYSLEIGDEHGDWVIDSGPSCLLVALLFWGFAWLALILPLLKPITGHLWPGLGAGVPDAPSPASWVLGLPALACGTVAFAIWWRHSQVLIEARGPLRVIERRLWGSTEVEIERDEVAGLAVAAGHLWVTYRDGRERHRLFMTLDTGSDHDMAKLVREDVERFNAMLEGLG